MIRLRLEDFRDGNYPEENDRAELYVLRTGDLVLYVGITTQNIWNRWFAQFTGHMQRNIYGEWMHNSTVGLAVLQHMPEALDWTVELWMLEDCKVYLKDDLASIVRQELIDIHEIEPLMINRLAPSLNAMLISPGTKREYFHVGTPLDEMQKAHREIFK